LRVELFARPELGPDDLQAFRERLARVLPPQAAVRFIELEARGPQTKRRVIAREF
jgi:hypothetical protein